MAATALDLLPFEVWPSQIDAAADPANNNALRAEVITRPAISFIAALPGSPANGDLHVLSAAIGEEVAGTLAFYTSGTWTYWVPVIGMLKRIGATNYYTYDPDSSAEWQLYDPAASAVTSVNDETGAVQVLVPIQIAVGDETTDLTAGTGKVKFRMPFAMTLLAGNAGARASVNVAPTGANIQVDINQDTGSGPGSIFTTPITIDAGEKTSVTAATPPSISDTTLEDDAEIIIDLDQVGSTIPGQGLKVTLIGYRTPAP